MSFKLTEKLQIFSMQINSNHQLYFNLADLRFYAMSTANSTNVKWVECSRLKEMDTKRGHK